MLNTCSKLTKIAHVNDSLTSTATAIYWELLTPAQVVSTDLAPKNHTNCVQVKASNKSFHSNQMHVYEHQY